MGEIVRVLKWRLDVDAEGMASGIDKAATSAERLQKATAEVGEKGAAGLKKVSTAAAETEVAFEGMGLEAKQVEMYLGRLEKGSGSPLVLQRNAELAQAALAVLASKAEAAGTALDSAFTGRVETAIAGAKEQAAGMNAELEKMGGQTPTKLDKVIVALEKTEQSAAGAWSAIERMGQEGAAAAAALAKLDKASDSPRELARAAALADMEMQQLRAAIDRAAASGEKMSAALAGAMTSAETKIEAANVRAAKLRDTMGDMKTKGDLAAKGFEAAAGAAGSFEGMLGRLNDTGGKNAQVFAKVGFAVVAAGAAFEMGYAQGEKLRSGLVALGVPLPDLSDKFASLTLKIEETIRGYQKSELVENAAVKRAREIIAAKEAQAKAENAAEVAMEKALPGFKSTVDRQNELKNAIGAASQAFEKMTAAGYDWRKEVEANQQPLAELAKRIEAGKVALADLPTPLRDAIEYLKQLQGASQEAGTGVDALSMALSNIGRGDVIAAIEAVAKALAKIRAEGGSVGDAVAANAAAFQQMREEAEKNGDALQKFRTDIMDQIPAYQATALTAGDYAKSVDEINAAWERAAEARRRMNEEDIAASIAMSQMKDQASQMVYAIDSIGEAYQRATGQCAGFTTEVRRGRKEVVEADPEWTKFIDSLAGVSDEYERMIPWVGALIAQLEQGNITGAEFQKQIEAWRTGFIQLQGVSGAMFGDIDTLFNRLNHLMNEFTRGGGTGGNDRFTPKKKG